MISARSSRPAGPAKRSPSSWCATACATLPVVIAANADQASPLFGKPYVGVSSSQAFETIDHCLPQPPTPCSTSSPRRGR